MHGSVTENSGHGPESTNKWRVRIILADLVNLCLHAGVEVFFLVLDSNKVVSGSIMIFFLFIYVLISENSKEDLTHEKEALVLMLSAAINATLRLAVATPKQPNLQQPKQVIKKPPKRNRR